jgi:hypothetical protein
MATTAEIIPWLAQFKHSCVLTCINQPVYNPDKHLEATVLKNYLTVLEFTGRGVP